MISSLILAFPSGSGCMACFRPPELPHATIRREEAKVGLVGEGKESEKCIRGSYRRD